MVWILLIFVGPALAFALAGMHEWFVFVLILLGALGIGELYAIRRKGKTLSHLFLDETRRRPSVAAILTALLATSFALVLYHLWGGF